MSRSTVEYLRHILDEVEYLMEKTEGLNRDDFLKDDTLKRAFVRSIEVMGEAVKQIPEATKQKYSSVEWRSIAAMRDRLIHHYFGIDFDIVWDAVTNKVPKLKPEIEKIIREEEKEET